MEQTAKTAFSNTFLMYYKAHSYHWNIEGKEFPQMHEFFGDLYDEIYGSVDKFAEEIRTLGFYAPRNLDEVYKYKTIDCDNVGQNVDTMIADLILANNQTIESLNKLFDELSAAKKQGFANFIADRIDAHSKHNWMLSSILKA